MRVDLLVLCNSLKTGARWGQDGGKMVSDAVMLLRIFEFTPYQSVMSGLNLNHNYT